MNWRVVVTLLFALLGAVPALAEPVPRGAMPRMTTPTADYCAHLIREVDRARSSNPRADDRALLLADEGARMCDRGSYRGGVVRLRRALIMMRNGR